MNGESDELLRLEVADPEAAAPPLPSRRTYAKACLACGAAALAAALAIGLIALVRQPDLKSAALDFSEDFAAPNKPCLCLFDIDRTLTVRQDAADRCPTASQVFNTPNGGVVMDYAYGGGPLRLSEVAQHLDQTFCSIDRCYMGVISAGGGSGPDEQGILYDKLNAASGGKAGDGSWSNWGKGPMNSQKIVFTPDPKKGCAAKQLFDWLNGEKQAGIAPDEVYLFDDRWGNAAEMAEFGFNGREISCAPRDKMIGNGVVGLCGALLREIRREKGIKTCQQLVEEGFYK